MHIPNLDGLSLLLLMKRERKNLSEQSGTGAGCKPRMEILNPLTHFPGHALTNSRLSEGSQVSRMASQVSPEGSHVSGGGN